MLSELLALIDTYEFEHNGWIALRSARWIDDNLHLEFFLDAGCGNPTSWLVCCSGVFEYHLSGNASGGLNHWTGSHPAINQYTDAQQSLYFARAPGNSWELIGRLWQAHVDQVDDWIPFDRYLNRHSKLQTILSGGYGLLAHGPSGLIETYGKILSDLDCEPTVVENGDPGPRLSAELIHSGSSFVVCGSIAATRAPA